MKLKQRLAKDAGVGNLGLQIVGDIALVKMKGTAAEKRRLAEGIMGSMPGIRNVCEIKQVKGEFREPEVSLILGDRTQTIHTENGVKFFLDVAKVMFSKGNAGERKRLIPLVKDGETIVDMFAGIGYFSLPIAKHARPGKIVAVEKNVTAFRFLKDNIKINNASMDAIWGDCRDFSDSVRNFADRVIMGYFPGTHEFLPSAIRIAKSGGVIHYHNTYRTNELWKKPVADISEACRREGASFRVISKRKVKSYAPNVWHAVVDFTKG
jgi:tRNA wybutosine-synthesizing protein 2